MFRARASGELLPADARGVQCFYYGDGYPLGTRWASAPRPVQRPTVQLGLTLLALGLAVLLGLLRFLRQAQRHNQGVDHHAVLRICL
jgi:hypothetical protein